MKKVMLAAFSTLAMMACGDNTANQQDSAPSPAADTNTINSGATASPDTIQGTSTTGGTGSTTPSGTTDGSNNSGAVGGSNSKTSGTSSGSLDSSKIKKK